MNAKPILFHVGSYADEGSPGLHLCRLDPANGRLERLDSISAGANPSFLALHPGGRYLYAVNEQKVYQGRPGGAVCAFVLDPETGTPLLLNRQPSHGTDPCHLSLDRTGRFVLAANYSSGSLAVFPLEQDGRLAAASTVVQHQGRGPNAARQEGPHAHAIEPDPGNRFALACDLGLDRLLVYRFDLATGGLALHNEAQLRPGAGPRHLAFHPDGRRLYVINELDSTLTVFAYEGDDGRLDELQTITTLPGDYRGPNDCAEVCMHPSGNFVYASNRGHDSLAVYRVEEATGRLALLGHEPVRGKTPRHFTLTPAGDFLLVANQDSDSISLFRLDPQTGGLDWLAALEIPRPTCVQIEVSGPG